jgi:alpha-tubulin suppressor-like RCC1 family protein
MTNVAVLAEFGTKEPLVLKFRRHSELFRWYRDGANGAQPLELVPQSVPVVGDVRAGASCFVSQLASGLVGTWGPAIHGHLLGRKVDCDTPAHEPHEMDLPLDLVGAIVRASLCGNLGAVVTSGGGAYVWGEVLSPPLAGGFALSKKLFWDETQLLKMVVIEEDGEQLDVGDMDVGVSHLVCLTAGGHVWVAGTNENGQLGVTKSPPKTEWTRLGGFVAKKVVCGPQSTFFICKDDGSL